MSGSWWSKLFFRKKSRSIVNKYHASHNANIAAIDALKGQGADLTQARAILHYLYLPNQTACDQVTLSLHEEGYETQETAASLGVIARTVAIINDATIQEMTDRFEMLAKEHHGEYDGWEAATDED